MSSAWCTASAVGLQSHVLCFGSCVCCYSLWWHGATATGGILLLLLLQVIKAQDPSVLVLVDNCYGEFTEEQEPTAVGAGELKLVT